MNKSLVRSSIVLNQYKLVELIYGIAEDYYTESEDEAKERDADQRRVISLSIDGEVTHLE